MDTQRSPPIDASGVCRLTLMIFIVVVIIITAVVANEVSRPRPVKKKGGTAAGVPRSTGELSSSVANGAPKDQV